MNQTKLPPGPKGWPVLGNFVERLRHPLEFYSNAAAEYGDIAHLPMGPIQVILLTHPDYVKHVLQDHVDIYQKGTSYDGLRQFLGKGLLTAEGELWRRQRKLVQPAFHRPVIQSLLPVMQECMAEWITDWQPEKGAKDKKVDAHHSMLKLTLEIAARTLFGSSLSDRDRNKLTSVMSTLIHQANADALSLIKFPKWMPTPRNLKVKNALNAIDEILFRAISKRLEPGAPTHKDCLGMFIAARDDETKGGMSTQQLRDEVVSFFVAGHETTANSLSWAFYLIAGDERVQDKIYEEIKANAGNAFDLNLYPYTTAVIKETLRLYPPGWIIPRQPKHTDEIAGFSISPKFIAVTSPYVMHRHPRYWQNPNAFNPERFLQGEEPNKYVYFPFGVGPRSCIGAQFAMQEMCIVITKTLQQYKLRLPANYQATPDPVITLKPKNGISLLISQR